ncbi:SDR family oxidoreductase [uncultured Microscilla sp.]|uniref:SDR family oxidoreductase n=1 Tax=uncultured Microscilla sp. TaxID=432653 RepID=UPI0026065350|nr:SDR family oxidoreductase [uncultured Microscilla sp.]
MDLNLQGKNAFVAGSTQGIGKASAIALAQLGARVTLLARNETRLKHVLEELDTSAGQVHDYILVDFSEPDSLREKIDAYLSDTPQAIHILINNTGGPPGGPIANAEIEEFKSAIDMHLVCNHILVQGLMEGMRKEGFGRIVNVISTSVKQPINGLGVSNTVRGAVANWSKTLANELGQYGITVNNVLPGFTKTARLEQIVENRAQKLKKSNEEIEEIMKAGVPARRFAEAEEVANAIVFLASPAAGYINGINVPVDGGRTACL